MIVGARRAHARDNDDIIAGLKLCLVQAVDFSETAANTVAHDCVADLVGNSEPDSVALPLRFAAIDGKAWRSGAVSFGIETPKFMILF